jgi:hypothetical protein
VVWAPLGAPRYGSALFGAVRHDLTDPTKMRALGFCVDVDHAMRFTEAGLASRSRRARRWGATRIGTTGGAGAQATARRASSARIRAR